MNPDPQSHSRDHPPSRRHRRHFPAEHEDPGTRPHIPIAPPASLAACGRSSVVIVGGEDGGSDSEAELCNGLDDDRDGSIDEDFRDGDGRYVHAAHCGACGRACHAQIACL